MFGKESGGAGSKLPWRPNLRQRRVLDALVEGKTNPEIATELGITLDGAKWHVSELMGRTGAPDRQELTRWWQNERHRQAPVVWLPLALKAGLALAAAAIVAGIPLLLLSDSGASIPPELTPALGVDLPAPTPVNPWADIPYPAGFSDCPVTRPNGAVPPGEARLPSYHGNGVLWTALPLDGRLVFSKGTPGFDVQPDGSVGTKWVWWTTIRASDFAAEGRRLDGPGSFSGDFTPGVSGGSVSRDSGASGGGAPVWVGGPSFSGEGCWQVTASLGGQTLSVVIYIQVLE